MATKYTSMRKRRYILQIRYDSNYYFWIQLYL